jgi:hypothetical protein
MQRETLELLHEVLRRLRPKPITAHVANVFRGGTQMADNVLVFNVGDTAVDTLTPRLADGVTPSGGVVSGVTVSFSDPSATAVVQADGTILFTGVAASTSPVSGSASCTVTDTDGVVSTWTVAFTVTTNAVAPPPQQLTQSVANVFVVTPASGPASAKLGTRGPNEIAPHAK